MQGTNSPSLSIRDALGGITPLAHEDTMRHYIARLEAELSAIACGCKVAAFGADDLSAMALALQESGGCTETAQRLTELADSGVEEAAFDAADLSKVAFALQKRAAALDLQAAAIQRNYNITRRLQRVEEAQAIAARNRQLARRLAALADSGHATVIVGAEAG